jgi:hypothetical protein
MDSPSSIALDSSSLENNSNSAESQLPPAINQLLIKNFDNPDEIKPLDVAHIESDTKILHFPQGLQLALSNWLMTYFFLYFL